VVFVGNAGGEFYALKTSNGKKAWPIFDSLDGGFRTSAVVANGVAYAATDGGALYAFDASSGHQVLSTTVGFTPLTSPAVVNGTVYVGSSDHSMYALGL